jgi:endonuclease YncB( thermonuclease family)
MRYLILAFLLPLSALADEAAGKVVRVQDGDTLTVLVDRTQLKVRLLDIDAPELGQPFGRRSRQSLASICAERSARVVWNNKDRYGRILGQVTCAGIEANASQVRNEMAWVFVRYAPKNSPYYALESQARTAKQGLWSDSSPISPWDWRSNSREAKRRH